MRLRHIARPYHGYRRIRKTGRFSVGPPAVLAGGFTLLIALGTVLLSLPWANKQPISWFQALFSATSAVTVTGLSIVDTTQQFTPLGQVILAVLVQLGGLGFVTFAVLAATTLGRKISLTQQSLALEAFNQTRVDRIHETAVFVCKFALSIQLLAFLILGAYWSWVMPWTDAWGQAAFHVIMAFNNAGMSLRGTQMHQHLDATLVVLLTTGLIILGGIGFTVLADCWHKRRWKKLSPYTRAIILATLLLNLVGFALLWLLETRNPLTLANLPLPEQAMGAWLQTVAARTAGFHGLDPAHLTQGSTLILMLLMFIGGGSMSTASGIKVGTFIVLLAAAYSYIRGRSEILLLKRSVSPEIVYKALALLMLTIGLGFLGTLLVSLFHPQANFLDLMFEIVSAISTTGMTRGVTTELGWPSQTVLLLLMFIGRVGPLTLIYSLSVRTRSRVRYPEAHFQVG